MKLTIECTKEQAWLLINCLEESFSFRMSQGNNFLDYILLEKLDDIKRNSNNVDDDFDDWCDNRDKAQEKCKELIEIIYEKNNTKLPKEAHEIADMWRVIRHSVYMLDHDALSFMGIRSDEPIQLSDMPLIKCEVEE